MDACNTEMFLHDIELRFTGSRLQSKNDLNNPRVPE
jgi:hypothetical protein